MKNKIKYAIAVFITLVIVIVSINLFQPIREQRIRGSIEILVSDSSYDYLVKCANNFMELNDKTTVKISKMDSYKQIEDAIKEPNKVNQYNIVQIDRYNFEKLDISNMQYYDEETEILNTYNKNFSKYRVNQVMHDDKVVGIPLTSRPLALYVREDMLKEYGYSREDMNTWKDVITIGKDVYEKSGGKIRIINATGQDYEDLLDLLTMQNLEKDKEIKDIKEDINNKIQELKDNNILNLEDGGAFLARISSINAIKEITAIEEPCEWSVGNVPSSEPGTNKFFAGEGDNLVVLNQGSSNSQLIEKFITYVMTSNKDTIKYVKNGDFFSSYLYTYKNKEIEEQLKNFVGKSPLIVLSNIEDKVLECEDYDKYLEVKKELRS